MGDPLHLVSPHVLCLPQYQQAWVWGMIMVNINNKGGKKKIDKEFKRKTNLTLNKILYKLYTSYTIILEWINDAMWDSDTKTRKQKGENLLIFFFHFRRKFLSSFFSCGLKKTFLIQNQSVIELPKWCAYWILHDSLIIFNIKYLLE